MKKNFDVGIIGGALAVSAWLRGSRKPVSQSRSTNAMRPPNRVHRDFAFTSVPTAAARFTSACRRGFGKFST